MDRGYISRFEDIEWIPGALEALGLLKSRGYKIIVVTNQSGVARGYYREEDVLAIHRAFDREFLRLGLSSPEDPLVSGYYHCPHHPDRTGLCACRKPSPGMILRGAEEHGVDLSRSHMVGDKLSDLGAGLAVGIDTILVRTGYGRTVTELPPGVREAEELLGAARLIVAGPGDPGPAL